MVPLDGVFARRWEMASKLAGRPRDDVTLETFVSPIDRDCVNLVVSLVNTAGSERDVSDFGSSYPTSSDIDGADSLRVGPKESEFELLARDEDGREVPLTSAGRKWMEGHEIKWKWPLKRGEAIGFVFSFADAFAVVRGRSYAVMAVFRKKGTNAPAWVSLPTRVSVEEQGIPGTNRPPYGSPHFWGRLADLAGRPQTDLVARLTPNVRSETVQLKMELENRGNRLVRPFSSLMMYNRELFLVRDDRGSPVLPNDNAGWSGCDWEFQNQTVLSPLSRRALCGYSLGTFYHLRAGCTYSVISAISLTGDLHDLVATPPVDFVAPDSNAAAENRSTAPATCATQSAAADERSFAKRWRELGTFAGKPYSGLLLEASAGEGALMKLRLSNVAGRQIMVTRWNGASGYEFLVRDAVGRQVPPTKSGTKLLEARNALKSARLRPGRATDESVSLDEYFAIRPSGEYTVLVSVPIVGDVDAVLTAAPVKLHVIAKSPATPKR